MTMSTSGKKHMNKILLDTNVLIYAIDADSKYHKKSLELINDSTLSLYTTSKNISEFLVVLTRTEAVRIEVQEALEILLDLLLNIIVLYPTERSSEVFYNLLKKYNPSGLRIHDFEIISIGLSYGIRKITHVSHNI